MERVLSSLDGAETVGAAAAVLVGLVVCFLGYRLLRIVVAICGFAVGAALGYLLAGLLGGSEQVTWIAALVGGLTGAALGAAVFRFGVFLVGAAAGAVVGGMIGSQLTGNAAVAAIPVAAVLLGILAVASRRIVIIFATASSGSWVAATAGSALLAGRTVAWDDFLGDPFGLPLTGAALIGFVAAWALLGISGAVVQFRSKKK